MDITSANSVFVLSVPDVFAVPQILQQYATDDAFSTTETTIGDVFKGVDGRISGAYIPFIIEQMVVFQADSPSIGLTMEVWAGANIADQTSYLASATISLPSVGRMYQMIDGFLTRLTPITQAKKYLQPVTYQISWGGWQPMPLP